MLKIIITP